MRVSVRAVQTQRFRCNQVVFRERSTGRVVRREQDRVLGRVALVLRDPALDDRHLVLRERARLVRADGRGAAHGLARVEVAHEDVVLHRLAHAVRQRERHGLPTTKRTKRTREAPIQYGQ